MASKKNTRRALFMSVISLVLCCAMLMGTTFAWFTDEVKSGINTINAGNLDVELYHSDKDATNEKVSGETKLFDDVELWEPGAVAYENLVVANEGNLALKYQLSINVSEETIVNNHGLSEALKVAVVKDGFSEGREEAAKLTNLVPLSSFVLSDVLEGDTKSETYGVVIYWQPSENDNNFNMKNVAKNTDDGSAVAPLSIKLGVNLFATQEVYEEDSFGPDYDETASMKATANADGSATLSAASAPSTTTNETTVEAPAGAFGNGDEVEVVVNSDNTLFKVNSNGAVVASLDVTLRVNGETYNTELTDGKVYTVKTYISKGLDSESIGVTYTGTDGKAQPTLVSYDSKTGLLVFTTNHFSEYQVSAKAFGYTGDSAYGTAKEAADAIIAGVTVIVPEADKANVVEAAGNSKDVVAALATVKIGNDSYLTLAEAMDDVATNGSSITKITLLSNVNMEANTITVPSGAIVQLDLNGHVLSGTCNANQAHLIMVNNGAELTVKDSSSAQSGKITYAKGSSGTGWTIDLKGKLNLASGTIELTGSDWNIGYAVDVRPNAWGTAYTKPTVFTMNGGKLVSSDGAVRVASSSDDSYPDIVAKFVMDGGKIEAAWDGVFIQQSNAAYDTLDVQLNGGTITSSLAPVRIYGPNANSVNSGAEKPMTLSVTGTSLVMQDTADTSKTWYEVGKVMYGGGMTLDNLNKYATITGVK